MSVWPEEASGALTFPIRRGLWRHAPTGVGVRVAGAGWGEVMPQLARQNTGAPCQGHQVLIRSHETRPTEAAVGGTICKRCFWLWCCPLRRETPVIWRHVTIIPQDHVRTLAQRALDIAQSSGEEFVRSAADVPLEMGAKDAPDSTQSSLVSAAEQQSSPFLPS